MIQMTPRTGHGEWGRHGTEGGQTETASLRREHLNRERNSEGTGLGRVRGRIFLTGENTCKA